MDLTRVRGVMGIIISVLFRRVCFSDPGLLRWVQVGLSCFPRTRRWGVLVPPRLLG